jgi:hypothetical protein
VVASVVGFYVLVHVFYWSEIRYRQYVTPFLWIYAGVAVERLATRAGRIRAGRPLGS